jgi:rod shape-determining protein MreC
MHDRAVRRRRAVLLALIAASLVLLTAYFGESDNGSLRSFQRGAMAVFAPIQEGANRAVKPVRDLFGWFGSTLDAKSQRDELKKQRDALRNELALTDVALSDARQQAGLKAQDTSGGLGRYQPVQARVYERSPSTWYQTVAINKGSSDGIHRNDPVINSEGLVGKVDEVASNSATVTLITDQDFAATGVTANSQEPGSVSPAVGAPGDLLFELVDNASNVRVNDLIITAGTRSGRLSSLYPRGIPIGTVSRIDIGQGELDRTIHIKPAADLRRLDLVQVLTAPHADIRAQVGP